ncbi:MAG TPA: sugar ABC transporter permease, partial [Caldilineaceae bacterium]|nr:sugar ABC transporter permease [Caldilineaceae bacterium]
MFGLLPKGHLARREAIWFWIFILPWVIGFILFRGGPILASLFLSFTEYNVASSPEWVALDNFTRLASDPIFIKSLQVSVYYTFLSVPLGIVVSLAMAMMLNQKGVPFLGILRTLYYIPALVAGSVAVALLFQWILNPSFGILNYLLGLFVGPNGIIPL